MGTDSRQKSHSEYKAKCSSFDAILLFWQLELR